MSERTIGEILIGDSPAIRNVRSLIARVGPTRLPVLIQGPTGAGKELVARALHLASGRQGSLVAFNVSAIAESLFESAIFGHVRGAFSGAIARAPGFLLEAEGGTCFMDEIGALPVSMQVKLLRALDDGVIRPVGAQADRRIDFRLVAATNESITELMRGGRFRADLAYRLRGFLIEVPSLDERRDDIPVLAEYFAARWTGAVGERVQFSRAALELLRARRWPGNVRELKHVVERVAALAPTTLITTEVLRGLLTDADDCVRQGVSSAGEEREHLLQVLEAVDWNRASAAQHLVVHPITVYRRMKRLGIVPPTNGTQTRRDI